MQTISRINADLYLNRTFYSSFRTINIFLILTRWNFTSNNKTPRADWIFHSHSARGFFYALRNCHYNSHELSIVFITEMMLWERRARTEKNGICMIQIFSKAIQIKMSRAEVFLSGTFSLFIQCKIPEYQYQDSIQNMHSPLYALA